MLSSLELDKCLVAVALCLARTQKNGSHALQESKFYSIKNLILQVGVNFIIFGNIMDCKFSNHFLKRTAEFTKYRQRQENALFSCDCKPREDFVVPS